MSSEPNDVSESEPAGDPSASAPPTKLFDQPATLNITDESDSRVPPEQEPTAPQPMATSTPIGSSPDVREDSSPKPPVEEGRPKQGGLRVVDPNAQPVSERLVDFKNWSVAQLKSTRQFLAESLGRGSRTVDAQLEERVEKLRNSRGKYSDLLKLAQRHCTQLRQTISTQRALATAFGEFASREASLRTELGRNCETQRQVARNGEILLAALTTFVSNLTTLLSTTMEDTFAQLREYETARIEYDAFRNDEISAQAALEAKPNDPGRKARLERKQREVADRKRVFETLRRDVTVRVHFLEDNQLKVMHRQLLLFHNASCAYYTGDVELLEKCVRLFHVKLPQSLIGNIETKVESDSLKPLSLAQDDGPSASFSEFLSEQATKQP